MNVELGTLVEVDPRTVWPNEANDFTPWLRSNVDQLSATIGLDLEISEVEGVVGSFAVDMVGRDLGSGRHVVIENQLGPTDHIHLGQLLTYAAGRGARVVVWVSTKFREEHQQVLEWLNDNTTEEQAFYGVELKVIRVDESVPAPLFRVVSGPKEQPTLPSVSERGAAYRAFWTDLLAKLKQRAPGITKSTKVQPANWFTIGAGRSGFAYTVSFVLGGRFRVELYIDTGEREKNKAAFEQLLVDRESIQNELGEPLVWEKLEHARASRVALYTEGSIDSSEENLAGLQEWALERVIAVREVLGERIRKLDLKTVEAR